MGWLYFFWAGFTRVIPVGFGWLEYEVEGRCHYTVNKEDATN
jgi:hypothetical protein